MTEMEQPTRMQRFAAGVAKRLAGKLWPTPSTVTTTAGVGTGEGQQLYRAFIKVSSKRKAVYRDVLEMDATVDEVAGALDILADNAVSAEGGAEESFWVAYEDGSNVPEDVRALIEDTIRQTGWQEKAYAIARDLLLYGDNFLQYVLDEDLNIVRLMWMPPPTMVRNEDPQGLLMEPTVDGEFPYEQVLPGTETVSARFFAWQIEHMRWNHSGGRVYGRSLYYTARTAWRKLQAMEEALVINWLTRAFARLLFTIDVTGKTKPEAEQMIRDFIQSLQTRKIAAGVEGAEQLSVVKDIFVGKGMHEIGGKAHAGLTDVEVLDTSNSGFTNLDPIEYLRSKVIMSGKVPKAYLGLEKDINAKATLVQQDRRFARTVRRIQSTLSRSIKHTINLQLILKGFDPTKIQYLLMWPAPSIADVVTASIALRNNTKAAEALLAQGVVDQEYVALKYLRMSPTEWVAVQKRVQAQAKIVTAANAAELPEEKEEEEEEE